MVGGPNCPNSAAGIIQNLQAGKRWFVFGEPVCVFEQPINLFTLGLGQRDLRLEGGGPGVTRIVRGFSGGSLISFDQPADGWRWTMSGIEFDGNRQQYPMAGPLISVGNVYLSYFENCSFRNSSGDGFVAVPSAAVLSFVHCFFDSNGGYGMRATDVGQFSFLGGGARGNGLGGLFLSLNPNGIPLSPGEYCAPVIGSKARGEHYLHGMHFQGNGYASGVVMVGNKPSIVRNCRFVGNNLVLSTGNGTVLIENNSFTSGATISGSNPGGLNRYNDFL